MDCSGLTSRLLPLLILPLLGAPAERAQPPAGVWQTYHDHARLTRELKDLAAAHPDLMRLRSIGRSLQDREIWLATLRSPHRTGSHPEALFDGATHGSEVIGAESMLAYIRYLVEGYATDPAAREILDGWTTYVIPMVNPDGVEAGKTAPTGKLARKNANQVDLNRNFDWKWEEAGAESPNSWEYRGPGPFSEPESRTLRDFVLQHRSLLYLNAHAGTDGLHLITERDSPDEALFARAASEIARITPYRRVRGHKPGEAGHWVYAKGMEALRARGAHPLAFALEIYTESGVPINAPNWWVRYAPKEADVPLWTERVRKVLIALTLLTSRLQRG